MARSNKLRVAEFRRNRKLQSVEYKGGKCQSCGYNRSVSALDFHHRDPSEKDFQLSRGDCRSWEEVKKELDKCDLLCANCHREEHERLKSSDIQRQLTNEPAAVRPKRELVKAVCPECSGEFLATPAESMDGTTCSYRCSQRSRRKFDYPDSDAMRKLVWSKPVLTIAKEHKISSSRLKRICAAMGVETPPRGYWMKNQQVNMETEGNKVQL